MKSTLAHGLLYYKQHSFIQFKQNCSRVSNLRHIKHPIIISEIDLQNGLNHEASLTDIAREMKSQVKPKVFIHADGTGFLECLTVRSFT